MLHQPVVETFPEASTLRPNLVKRDWTEAPVEDPIKMVWVTLSREWTKA